MGAYILRRLLLIVPTLFGILLINFVLVQFMPGGPIEQIIAQLDGEPSGALDRIAGGGGGGGRRRHANTAARRACRPSSSPISSGSSASTSRRSSASC